MGGKVFKRRLAHSVAAAMLKSLIANVLKWKAGLQTKFKCVCVAKRSLVMGCFSRDLLVNQLRYLQCLNLVNNYLHEYNIYIAPGF